MPSLGIVVIFWCDRMHRMTDGRGRPDAGGRAWQLVVGDPCALVDAIIGIRLIFGSGEPLIGMMSGSLRRPTLRKPP